MKVINIVVGQTPQSYGIVIGRRGENDATQIVFDVSQLVANYGDGSAVLMAKRPTDSTAYPVTTTRTGNNVTWTVSDTDTSYKGKGECELFWYVGETLAKTIVYSTTCGRDIGTTTQDAPDAYETWVDELTALGAETLQNAQDAAQSASDAAASAAEITGMSAVAETLAAGASATASYSNGTLTLGIPTGATGPQGPQGETGVGVPTGGTAGQVLAKRSGTDFDTEWVNQSGSGGTSAYIITDPNGDGNIIITEVG